MNRITKKQLHELIYAAQLDDKEYPETEFEDLNLTIAELKQMEEDYRKKYDLGKSTQYLSESSPFYSRQNKIEEPNIEMLASEYTARPKLSYSTSEKMSYKRGLAKGKKRTKAKPKYSKRKGGGGGSGRGAIIYPNVVSGYGDYVVNADDNYGRQVGGGIGSRIGEFVGGLAHNAISSFATGFGDYDVRHNVLLAPDLPIMINDSVKGGTVIRHREYLNDIITSSTAGAFKLDSYPLNPAMEKTFPFLSQIAANYEQYSLEGCIFQYRSMSADALNSTNTALGSVMMATNYDSLDLNFQNKSEIENYMFGMSCKPSVDMLHPIECAPRQTTITELYTRNGAPPANSDLRLYDWGNFQIATVGGQAASINIGELWITYQVRLLKAKLFSSLGEFNNSSKIVRNGWTNANPLGLLANQTINYNSIGLVVSDTSSFSFPISGSPNTFTVRINWLATVAVAIVYPVLGFTNCSIGSFIGNTTPSTDQIPEGGATVARCEIVFAVQTVPQLQAIVQLGTGGNLPTGFGNVYIRVIQVANSAFNV